MSPIVERAPSDDELREQAYLLVVTARETPSQENLDALADWAGRSVRHRQILQSAERLVRTIPQGARQPLNRRQRLSMFFEVLWAKWERRSGVLIGALASTLVLGVILIDTLDGDRPGVSSAPPVSAPLVYGTDHGQQREFTLADGSKVWLDWSSSLTVDYSSAKRLINLTDGNAWFEVTSDPGRPFVVTSGDVTTTVTGTQFAIQQYPGHVEIGVLEGSVAVQDAAGERVHLTPAETVTSVRGHLGAVTQMSDVNDIGTWRDGMIILRGRPFLEALSILAPYSRLNLDTTNLNPDFMTPVSGTFFIERADLAIWSIIEAQGLETAQGLDSTLILSHAAFGRQKSYR